MKKSLLYILIHFSSAVIADWITVEHDFNMCNRDVPSKNAAFHTDDDGITYSSSFLIREVQTVKHEYPLTTLNITMWGCTYDCNFSFMVNINRTDLTVSSYTEKTDNNYKCNLSNYTMKLIPTPNIVYMEKSPNPDHVFPTDLTAKHCSEGKHPDAPDFPINKTEHVAECIDYLTGNEVGTYAASLQFGSGSSFSPDYYGVATYHMINSANKLFNYWERHHRGFHEALSELSEKMTPDNLKELQPPPPPPPKRNLLKEILVPIAITILLCALTFVGTFLVGVAASLIGRVIVSISEFAAQLGAVEDAVELGVLDRIVALRNRIELIEQMADNYFRMGQPFEYDWDALAAEYRTTRGTVDAIRNSLYQNMGKEPEELEERKRDTTTANHTGFFTSNILNAFFLPSVMDNVHQSFAGNGQNHLDISSYLSAASENLLFHFDDTLHNNFFAENKSVLASFTVNQGMNNEKLLANDDDIYNIIKQNTYNVMAATIISITLKSFDVEICDPKPSFCGQSCNCPTIGDDKCVITASDGQINELNFLRDTFDICSTNTKKTGWNITHNANCEQKQFQC